MSEEEKEAIVQLKHYSNITAYWKQEEYTNSEVDSYIKTTLNYIEKLQKENKNAEERNYSLGLDFIQIGEKLGLESFGIQAILSGIGKLQKENQELKGKNKYQYELLGKFEEHIDRETIMKIYDKE